MKRLKNFFFLCITSITLKGIRAVLTAFQNHRTARGAFQVYYPQRVQSFMQRWKEELPTIRPQYAVKCNPDPHILQTLVDLGAGFDCASERELLEVKGLSRGPIQNRILQANPCKSDRNLKTAEELGSPTTVVDSCEEVEKLQEVSQSGGALVRIAVEDGASLMPFSNKFGCTMESVKKIAEVAHRKDIPLQGVSFHVGSGCSDGRTQELAIQQATHAQKILADVGHPVQVIDIGGGQVPQKPIFQKTALSIRIMQFNTEHALEGYPTPKWIAEPGRYFATNAMDFQVQVIGKKPSRRMGWSYTIDDSVQGQFTSILFDHQKPNWVRVRKADESPRPRSPGILFGRTCDSLDVIAKAESMEELEVGDWLQFPNMGAQTRATASEFNGFPSPDVFPFLNDDIPVLESHAMESLSRDYPTGVQTLPTMSSKALLQDAPAFLM